MTWFKMLFTKKAGVTSGTMTAMVMALAVPITAQWEGTRLTAYKDVVGVWTVCMGETKGVKAGDTYTQAQCETMLEKRLVEFYDGFKTCVPNIVQAPVEVQAAVTSWIYNNGVGAACLSTLARHIRAGAWLEACNQLPRWVYAGGKIWPGLINRRVAERGLCLSALS